MKTKRRIQKDGSKARTFAQHTNSFENEASAAVLLGRPHLDKELAASATVRSNTPLRLLGLADVFRSWARQLRSNQIQSPELVAQAEKWDAPKRVRMAVIFERWASQLWIKAAWAEPELRLGAEILSPPQRVAFADQLERWAKQLRSSAAILSCAKPLCQAAELLARN